MIALIAAIAVGSATVADPVTLHGIGDLRVGMPLSQLRQLGAVEDYPSDEDVDCSYWTIPDRDGLSLIVSGHRLVRIDIRSDQYRTLSGAAIGMDPTQVRRIYGRRLKIEPHPYAAPEGHYFVYRAKREPYGMIFETPGSRVESFRVGLWDQVRLIEGCQ